MSARDILHAVTWATSTTLIGLRSERRNASLVRARFVACWLLRNLTGRSYPEIAMDMGGRDHATIMHAVRRVDADIRTSGPLGEYLADVIGRLQRGVDA